jgi:RNA ligase
MLKVLEKYYNDGLVYKQVHPKLPLTIWNYSEKVQYESLWDDITLQTRGLVTDDKGNVVARPFKKFFNQDEGKHTPTSEFDVYAKMDGSLGVLFNYEGEWVMATRGSFTSDQAIKGMEMLSKYDYNRLNKGYTYLFEIIYAENRIVCQYSFEDVVLLGVIETTTGYEVNIHDGENDIRIRNLINNLGFQVVKKYDGIKDYSVLKEMIRDDEEGFVVRFNNGNRMKVKGVEYLRLHKIMTNVSTTGIWEVLSSGGNMDDLLKDVPDEFYKKIKEYVKQLRYQYWSVQEHAGKYFDNLYESYDRELPEKAKYAEWVKQFDKHLHPILFRMYDNKDYSSYIWKLIRPEFKKL